MGKVLLVARKKFRRLDAAHVLREVTGGGVYFNGVHVWNTEQEEEAA